MPSDKSIRREKNTGGLGTEGVCNKRTGCIGGDIRALGRTSPMG